jgi:AcrR family transcriptional regulator
LDSALLAFSRRNFRFLISNSDRQTAKPSERQRRGALRRYESRSPVCDTERLLEFVVLFAARLCKSLRYGLRPRRIALLVDCPGGHVYPGCMARPLSDEKRSSLLRAATRVIVTQGLGAQTAVIAREAGVASGSLFTYFETKKVLFNELYLELKAEMASAALENRPRNASLRKQLFSVWSNWMHWVISDPHKRRALAQLSVSEEITPETRVLSHKPMAGIAELLERCRAAGPMREASMSFVLSVMNSLAETTMDFMLQDPTNAERHCQVGFDALWRVLK